MTFFSSFVSPLPRRGWHRRGRRPGSAPLHHGRSFSLSSPRSPLPQLDFILMLMTSSLILQREISSDGEDVDMEGFEPVDIKSLNITPWQI